MPVFTIRLPDDVHEQLSAMALLESRPMAELGREAIERYIDGYATSDDLTERMNAEMRKWEAAVAVLSDKKKKTASR